MTYVFDIDGTVCTNTNGNYESAEPYLKRIEMINTLYEKGDKIVMFTARGMDRYKGDINKVNERFYFFTLKQLENWGLKFHELKLGKPAADFYVDDKGINDKDFFKDGNSKENN